MAGAASSDAAAREMSTQQETNTSTTKTTFQHAKHKATYQDGRDEEVVSRMHEVEFTALSDADIYKNSVAIIDRPDLYSRGDPAHNGPLDTRMGVNLRTVTCAVCSKSCNECGGHFGHTETVHPLFNYGYFHFVKAILNVICLVCCRIPVPERDKKALVQRIIRHDLRNELDLQRRKLLLATLAKKVGKIKVCIYCGAAVAPVRTEGMYFFIIEQPFPNAVEPEKPIRTKMYWDANRVRHILQWISYEDQILMLMDPRKCRPESLISQVLAISPVTIRPSVSHGAQMSFTEDDISIFFAQVVGMDKYIRSHLSTLTPNGFIDYWENLQYRWFRLVNANVKPPKGLDLHGPGSKTVRASKGFEQRLKGKMGRFRGNLSGKRVNYSSRTVISPDPNLRIDQVGVPAFVARKLTFPERVTTLNIDQLRTMVLNGPDVYPGAHRVATNQVPRRTKRLYVAKIRPAVAESLRVGDIVYRHVLDGDIVLFNRQPSLHKLSIMAHRVKVLNNRTFRFNECVCAPYNADFDGDEMNLHLLQTYQAKAEAEALMITTQNLATPKNGEILIAATQDFITGAYLISQRDRFYTRQEFFMFLGQVLQQKRASSTTQWLPIGSLGVDALESRLPPPAIWKPVPLWTGKQLMSVILAPEFDARRAHVNLSNKGKNYSHKFEEFCLADSFLTMRRGQILSGSLDKSLIGSGTKTNIFFRLMMDFGAEYAADAMFNLARTSIFHLITHGFSIGITDVRPSASLTERKEVLVQSGYIKCDEYIRSYTAGSLPCEPGMSPEETLESKILKELSLIRETAGKACLLELSRNNAPLIMALSGSKGSTINISQMVACVGQQAINGRRVANGFDNRTLPLFKDFSRDPKSKGFVANSFFTGLEPYEFIFHTMAGREGLVDTAVKTAETGYMYRRLMKALEDLVCKYDSTVRNAAHDILQFKFGDDGLDPREMEGDGEPIEFKHFMYDMKCTALPAAAAAAEEADLPTATKNSSSSIVGGHSVGARDAMRIVLQCASALGTREVNKLTQLLEGSSASETTQLSLVQWQHLCRALNSKCIRARLDPGTAAGALSAQSIGEPGTQMTLKTFHFAGVAAMNITLGVPRIKEIINAVRKISTPIIKIRLLHNKAELAARIVKARVERTTLAEITERMSEVYERNNFHLEIVPNGERIHYLRLECSVQSLKRAIDENDVIRKLGVVCRVSAPKYDKLLLTPPDVDTARPAAMRSIIKQQTKAAAAVSGNAAASSTKYFDQVSHRIKQIREVVGAVIVAGVPSISHAIIHYDDSDDAVIKPTNVSTTTSSAGVYSTGIYDEMLALNKTAATPDSSLRAEKSTKSNVAEKPAPPPKKGRFIIFAEGVGLQNVLGINGVDTSRTATNSCLEVADVLGIEAARQSIINEINDTMKSHGMTVDARHLQLLADLMCHQGVVLGITRHGMAKMRSSSFKLASFEVTLPSVYDAAFFGISDSMTGVTESIIAGQACNFGSGLPQIITRKSPAKALTARIHERLQGTDDSAAADNTLCSDWTVAAAGTGAHMQSLKLLKQSLAALQHNNIIENTNSASSNTGVNAAVMPTTKQRMPLLRANKRRPNRIDDDDDDDDDYDSENVGDAENVTVVKQEQKQQKISLFKQARTFAQQAAAAVATSSSVMLQSSAVQGSTATSVEEEDDYTIFTTPKEVDDGFDAASSSGALLSSRKRRILTAETAMTVDADDQTSVTTSNTSTSTNQQHINGSDAAGGVAKRKKRVHFDEAALEQQSMLLIDVAAAAAEAAAAEAAAHEFLLEQKAIAPSKSKTSKALIKSNVQSLPSRSETITTTTKRRPRLLSKKISAVNVKTEEVLPEVVPMVAVARAPLMKLRSRTNV